MERQLNEEHFSCLDGLKGIGACIIAFIWHYQHFSPQNGFPFYRVFLVSYNYGWCMVEIFFMLSGFGMMTGYGKRIFKHQMDFKHYIGKRIGKLYPLFLLTSIITIMLEYIYRCRTGETFIYSNFDFYHLLLNMFLIQDGYLGIEWSFNAPSWSISICIFCYILFYFIVYRAKEETHIYYYFASIVVIALGVFVMGVNYPMINSLMARGISCFSIGVLLSKIYMERGKMKAGKLGCFMVFFLLLFYRELRGGGQNIGNFTIAFIIGAAPMIILSVLFVPVLRKIAGCKLFVYLGSLSVEIYLFHFPIQCLIKVIDIYSGLGLNYSSRKIWMVYFLGVILTAVIYRVFLRKKSEKLVYGFFCRGV